MSKTKYVKTRNKIRYLFYKFEEKIHKDSFNFVIKFDIIN